MRMETIEPAFTKSRMDSDDPSLLMPYIDSELPRRTNERMEQLLPVCTKSTSDSAEPMRHMP